VEVEVVTLVVRVEHGVQRPLELEEVEVPFCLEQIKQVQQDLEMVKDR
jgi:hypothetical protein